jgi:hypothetical protein
MASPPHHPEVPLSPSAGYVGGPTMAMIARKCPTVTVTVVDLWKERIDAWNSDELPIYEPGLDELVKGVRGVNLFFTTDAERVIAESDIIFVSVNTPTKTFGIGAGHASNVKNLELAARTIAKVRCSIELLLLRRMQQLLRRLSIHSCGLSAICPLRLLIPLLKLPSVRAAAGVQEPQDRG